MMLEQWMVKYGEYMEHELNLSKSLVPRVWNMCIHPHNFLMQKTIETPQKIRKCSYSYIKYHQIGGRIFSTIDDTKPLVKKSMVNPFIFAESMRKNHLKSIHVMVQSYKSISVPFYDFVFSWISLISIFQWIGLRDNFNRKTPYISWENLWFPVKIFP